MNYAALTTTIVAAVLTLALIVGTVVLIITGNSVPDTWGTLMTTGFGIAVGGSVVASRSAAG